jgi:hypothetical protein
MARVRSCSDAIIAMWAAVGHEGACAVEPRVSSCGGLDAVVTVVPGTELLLDDVGVRTDDQEDDWPVVHGARRQGSGFRAARYEARDPGIRPDQGPFAARGTSPVACGGEHHSGPSCPESRFEVMEIFTPGRDVHVRSS